MSKTVLIQNLTTSKKLAAMLVAVGSIAAAPALAAGANDTTAPLPTDQRVLLTPNEQALQAERQRGAYAARAANAQSVASISTVGALPTDQRVLLTPSEEARELQADRAASERAARSASAVGVAAGAKTVSVSAPLPTDQRI